MTCLSSETDPNRLLWYDLLRNLVHTGKIYTLENITPQQSGKYFCKTQSSGENKNLDSNFIELNVTCKRWFLFFTIPLKSIIHHFLKNSLAIETQVICVDL